MSYISKEWLDMAYRVVVQVNMQGKTCNHARFHNAAFRMYFDDIKKRPVIIEYLGRALRELPKYHPDVERLMRDCYVIKDFSKCCEKEYVRERLRRIGCTGATLATTAAQKSSSSSQSPGEMAKAKGDQLLRSLANGGAVG